jgi:RNA polymerase sigma-70 factor (ECF subfamily)
VTDDQAKAAFEVGRAAWPAIDGLTFDRFRSFVHEAGVDVTAFEKYSGDLYLAAAAATGLPGAVMAFETELLSQLPRWLSRLDLSPDVVDEVRQSVRAKLLVGSPPKLCQYRAEGPLGGWVRMASVRVALDTCGSAAGYATLDESGREPLLKALNAEQRMIHDRYRSSLEKVLRAALGQLSKRDRNLLRFHYLAGMSHNAIARTYHVHRATVVRWLAAIRDELETVVRIRLWEESGISPSDFRSIWNAVKSDVEVSLSRLLGGE